MAQLNIISPDSCVLGALETQVNRLHGLEEDIDVESGETEWAIAGSFCQRRNDGRWFTGNGSGG